MYNKEKDLERRVLLRDIGTPPFEWALIEEVVADIRIYTMIDLDQASISQLQELLQGLLKAFYIYFDYMVYHHRKREAYRAYLHLSIVRMFSALEVEFNGKKISPLDSVVVEHDYVSFSRVKPYSQEQLRLSLIIMINILSRFDLAQIDYGTPLPQEFYDDWKQAILERILAKRRK